MSKARSQAIFGLGVILPLVLLFWPFAVWSGVPALLLRIIPAAVLQYLFCRRAKRPWVEAAPLLAASALPSGASSCSSPRPIGQMPPPGI